MARRMRQQEHAVIDDCIDDPDQCERSLEAYCPIAPGVGELGAGRLVGRTSRPHISRPPDDKHAPGVMSVK